MDWVTNVGGCSPNDHVKRAFRKIFKPKVIEQYFTWTGVDKSMRKGNNVYSLQATRIAKLILGKLINILMQW